MVDYAKLADTAKRLVEANGRDVTLHRRSRTPAVAGEPWRGPAEAPEDSYTVRAAIVPASGSGFGTMFEDLPGDLVRKVTEVAIVASNSLAAGDDPKQADSLVDGARAFKVQMVQELRPSTTSLVYLLGLSA